ncbi:MAG TPA: dienelactone hydrolase family protein, partial [Kofleriaceae bacterium]|nr:dienelactone hydrolase family protein [Kofleriaceae bacterium]
MIDVELLEERVELVREDGVTLPGWHITPGLVTAERMHGAGVVVVAGEWGLSEDVYARVARPLAQLGFVVVAMDLVRGQHTDDAAVAHARAAALDHVVAITDIQAGLLAVKELARGKLGVIGLDIAAQIALEAATVLPHVDAVVHAGGPVPGPSVPMAR